MLSNFLDLYAIGLPYKKQVMKNRISILSYVFMLSPLMIFAQHSFELGAGWGNMGVSPSTTWKPYSWSQGSRKEAAAMFSYRYVGEKKIYYAPFAKLHYGNNWSTSGGVNLLSLNLGAAGLGVHLLKPMSAYTSEERKGKWFGTFEINFASVSLGGNITPHIGVRGANSGVRQWIDTTRIFGNQYYPFKDTYQAKNNGQYSFIQYSVPVMFRFWNMLTPEIGLGFFLSANCLVLEKSLNFNAPVSIGYDIQGGLALLLFNKTQNSK
jgi:hypothetical protein